ncbi:MAG: hypothetical protein LAP21_04140 [Acidobacteriia bacterium]|nr:hypothetical protein [Terriglobia bacterium]
MLLNERSNLLPVAQRQVAKMKARLGNKDSDQNADKQVGSAEDQGFFAAMHTLAYDLLGQKVPIDSKESGDAVSGER